LNELRTEPRTLVFYESPHRLVRTLTDLAATFGNERPACVSREVSKLYEEHVRGTLAELLAHFTAKEPKGELVVCVGGAEG
jgi:16S rRNA (cytidine1402-2'-O)-methyltransferase